MWEVLGIVAYLVVAIAFFGFAFGQEDTNSVLCAALPFSAMFWPITLIMWFGYWLGKRIAK